MRFSTEVTGAEILARALGKLIAGAAEKAEMALSKKETASMGLSSFYV